MSFGGQLVYPQGVLATAPAPTWGADGATEMDYCQREFFLKYCNQVPQIPIRRLLNNDCICFMMAEEAAPWLPVWMCGSFFALEVLGDPYENSTSWTQYALEKCLVANNITVSLEAIDYFVKICCDSIEAEPDLYAKLAKYREGLKQ